MIYWIPVIVFVIVFIAVWQLNAAAEEAIIKRRLLRRLLREDTGLSEHNPLSSGGYVLIRLGKKLLPKSAEEREAIRYRLGRAGFHNRHALEMYYGIRAAGALIFLGIMFVSMLSWRGLSIQTLVVSYSSLMLGYYAPAWVLRRRQKDQARRIIRELPDALDILLVCMNAGLSFDRALLRVSQELRYVSPVLAKEFERYFYEVDSGLPRREALGNLAERNQVSALTSVVNVLLQSVRFGTDIAHALRLHADSLRKERRQLAEEKAAKISTKLVIPTVVFIMPALIIVVLGPTGIRLLERLQNVVW